MCGLDRIGWGDYVRVIGDANGDSGLRLRWSAKTRGTGDEMCRGGLRASDFKCWDGEGEMVGLGLIVRVYGGVSQKNITMNVEIDVDV